MRIVQRRVKHTEMLIWLTIIGVLAGSTSVVAVDWSTSRANSYAQTATLNSSRSRMLIDAESMNSVPSLIGPRLDGPSVSDGEYAIPVLPEVSQDLVSQDLTPETTAAPVAVADPKPKKPAPAATPPVAEPPTTESPAPAAPTTEPPATEPPATEPPVTESPTTQPPVAEDPPAHPQPVPVVDPVSEPDGDEAADSKAEREREKAEKKAEKERKKAEKKAERERRKAERKAKKGAESD